MTSFQELKKLIEYMRGPKGCAWDREQTIGDFKGYFRDESNEVLDAIRKEDYENLKEELGDVLWHIIFISQIAKEEGLFTVDDVMDGLKDKIVRRHPPRLRPREKAEDRGGGRKSIQGSQGKGEEETGGMSS